MKGLFIPEVTAEMFRNGCLESIEALMAEGEIYDIEYSPWIPVSERLPDDQIRVLFCADNDVYYGTRYCNRWWDDVMGDDVKDVEAWMPLPQPYKESE